MISNEFPNKGVLSSEKGGWVDPTWDKVLNSTGFLGEPVSPLYTGFPGVRAYVRVRKLVEAELTMTIKVKVVSLDE